MRTPGRAPRCDLEAVAPGRADPPASIAAGGEIALAMRVPTRRRGSIVLERVEIATRFPYGLFRAWAVLHPDLACLVYPRPAEMPRRRRRHRASRAAASRGAATTTSRDPSDYHLGDPPRHIAWKAYARAGELLIKEFSGDAEAMPLFDLADAPGVDLEARLSVLARWIVDAHARGQTFGLRLPGDEIPPEPGEAQRRRCLCRHCAL